MSCSIRGGHRTRPAATRIALALDGLQVCLQLRGGLVAPPAILFERLANNPFEFRRHVRVQDSAGAAARDSGWRRTRPRSWRPGTCARRWPSRRARRRRRRDPSGRRGLHRVPARATCTQPCRARSLCSCVTGSSAPRVAAAVSSGSSSAGASALARPKSRILAWPRGRDEDVGRLDVAVQDALRVRGVERVRDLDGEIEHRADRQRDGPRSCDRASARRAAPSR